jgi:2-oxoglutarate dehydrogenase E2 component (dihydrolipoamide succinyltransferase)
MSTEIKMPQLGESVTEGTVGRWLKQPGDTVARYEPLLEVVTDKVDTEVPAPVSGTLLEILVPEGETVRVGTVIALVGAAAGEPAESAAPPESAAPAESAPPAAAPRPADDAGAQRGYLSPVVSRLLAEHGLDARQITGTGQGGRLTKQDVLRFVEGRAGQADGASAPPAPAPADVLRQAPAGANLSDTPSVRPLPPAQEISAQPSAADAALPADAELLPLSPMRRSIAEHMVRSVRTAPHVTSVVEVDLSRVIAHRAANKGAFERQGVRLTFTAYFVQATLAGLQRAPVMNGSYTDQGVLVNRRIHIGMAVALDEGLIVPVIRDADEKNLLGLARAVNDLAERARARRLKPAETQGGTFTLTNHGTSGSLFATPIINQPQAGILGVGAVVKRPVVVSQGGVDAIAIKPMCYLSLTFDHRIADGAVGDAFLMAVKHRLEEYE